MTSKLRRNLTSKELSGIPEMTLYNAFWLSYGCTCIYTGTDTHTYTQTKTHKDIDIHTDIHTKTHTLKDTHTYK